MTWIVRVSFVAGILIVFQGSLQAKDFRFCSVALSVLGINSEQARHLTEEEAESLYAQKDTSPEARRRMAEAFIMLGLQKLFRYGFDSTHPQYEFVVENLFYKVILPAIGRFDQKKRGEATRDRPVKNNLASYMIGIFRYEIAKLIKQANEKAKKEVRSWDFIDLYEGNFTAEEAMSNVSRVWVEPEHDSVEDQLDAQTLSNIIHQILEEDFKQKLKRSAQWIGRVRIQRLILEEVWKRGRPMIDVIRQDGGIRQNFEDAQNDMREAVRRGLKKHSIAKELNFPLNIKN